MEKEEVIIPAEIPTEVKSEQPSDTETPRKEDEALLSDLESALKELEFF